MKSWPLSVVAVGAAAGAVGLGLWSRADSHASNDHRAALARLTPGDVAAKTAGAWTASGADPTAATRRLGDGWLVRYPVDAHRFAGDGQLDVAVFAGSGEARPLCVTVGAARPAAVEGFCPGSRGDLRTAYLRALTTTTSTR